MYKVGRKIIDDVEVQIAVDGKKKLHRALYPNGKVTAWRYFGGKARVAKNGGIYLGKERLIYSFSMNETKDLHLVEASQYEGQEGTLVMVGLTFYQLIAGMLFKTRKGEVQRNTLFVSWKGHFYDFKKTVICDDKGNYYG